jgi:hypothetical protein
MQWLILTKATDFLGKLNSLAIFCRVGITLYFNSVLISHTDFNSTMSHVIQINYSVLCVEYLCCCRDMKRKLLNNFAKARF